MSLTPFLIVGDGPQEPTGLGRIARDLGAIVRDLPVDLVQVGGTTPPTWTAWRHFPLNPSNEDWGASQVEAYYHDLWGDRPGILFLVWDPGRLFAYANIKLPVQKWVYTAIDAYNLRDTISGPAAFALTRFDRVLAYGRWGAQVLIPVLGPTAYLPHGLRLETFQAPPTEAEQAWVTAQLGAYFRPNMTLVGCVAANQPRKDLSLFIRTLTELRARGQNVYGWLHTDLLVGKAWSVPQLVEDCGFEKRLTVTGTQEPLTDRQLALLYQRCAITLAPGLGEGFGYPIAESLASGVPVIHGDYGGGRDLLPASWWRAPVAMLRVESAYALQRPVFRVEDWANATERVLRWKAEVGPEVCAAYCRGAVAHLDWSALAPRWRSWFTQGLEGL